MIPLPTWQAQLQLLNTSICKRQLTTPKAGLNDRSVTVNQGKTLGGSSAINAQVFVPPTKANFDAWETLGNEGWDWDMLQKNVTKTYTYPSVEEKLEAALGIDGWAAKNEAAKGPIQTSFPKVAVHEAWANTMKALGYSMANDPFLGTASGSFSNLLSIDPATKEKSYSASAYYQGIVRGLRGREWDSRGACIGGQQGHLVTSRETVLRANSLHFRPVVLVTMCETFFPGSS